MKNIFPITIITLFFLSAIVSLFSKEYAKASFYFFSATLNLTVLYMGA